VKATRGAMSCRSFRSTGCIGVAARGDCYRRAGVGFDRAGFEGPPYCDDCRNDLARIVFADVAGAYSHWLSTFRHSELSTRAPHRLWKDLPHFLERHKLRKRPTASAQAAGVAPLLVPSWCLHFLAFRYQPRFQG